MAGIQTRKRGQNTNTKMAVVEPMKKTNKLNGPILPGEGQNNSKADLAGMSSGKPKRVHKTTITKCNQRTDSSIEPLAGIQTRKRGQNTNTKMEVGEPAKKTKKLNEPILPGEGQHNSKADLAGMSSGRPKRVNKTTIEKINLPDESSLSSAKAARIKAIRNMRCVMDTSKHDFKLVRNYPAFVDKTLLIQEISNYSSIVVLSAPRRFGKSTNLTMMKYFYEMLPNKAAMKANRELFRGLNIQRFPDIVKKDQGKYPIIFLDFRAKGNINSYDAAISLFRTIVRNAYNAHSYLADNKKLKAASRSLIRKWCDDEEFNTLATTDIEIVTALENLAGYLKFHYKKKVMVLVDEYDSVCSESIIAVKDIINRKTNAIISPAEDELEKVIKLCVNSLSCLLKGNANVGRAIITGISYLATVGISKLNNTFVFKFQENNIISNYYGLTSDELKDLLCRFEKDNDYGEVRSYYNGYRNDMTNIFSVMNYLNSGTLQPYWQNSGIIENFSEALHVPAVRSQITSLLSDMSNEIEIDHLTKIELEDIRNLRCILTGGDLTCSNVTVFLNFILEQGYLKISEFNKDTKKCKVQLPNKEIRDEFLEKYIKFFRNDGKIDYESVKSCASHFDKLTASKNNNKQQFGLIVKLLNNIINSFVLSIKDEATLHHLIFFIILHTSKFKCFSEARTGVKRMKRLDLLMLGHDLGIIIELKYCKSADEGLNQIIRNRYNNAFKNVKYNPNMVKVKYFILIGLHMSAKKNITLSILFNCLKLQERIVFK